MNGPTAPCPACQQRSFERVIGVNSVTIWRCALCGLGTTVPRPTEANGHESFVEDPAYFASAYAQPKDRWWQRFNDVPLDLLQKAGTIPGQRFLDVGLGRSACSRVPSTKKLCSLIPASSGQGKISSSLQKLFLAFSLTARLDFARRWRFL